MSSFYEEYERDDDVVMMMVTLYNGSVFAAASMVESKYQNFVPVQIL